jgi:glycosyltransferase involved in cell wall biosynthesis
MARPSISVALATYNGERFLEEQLGSLARQTLLPAELVVRDDASGDGTIRILEAFAAAAPFPVRISVNGANRGPVETFLAAASECSGDWIAYCDQDDVWLEGKLGQIADVVETVPDVGMVSHSALQVGEGLERLKGVPRHPDHRGFTVTPPLRNPPMRAHPGFSCVFRRSLFEAVPFADRPRHKFDPDLREPHDNFVYNITNTYANLARLPDVLALHRRHGGAVTGEEGTGIKTGFAREKLASRGEQHAARLRNLADLAGSHRDFYERVVREYAPARGGDFERKTGRAVAYYGMLQKSYEARAAIYEPGAGLGRRVRDLARCLRVRAYADHEGGRGIGRAALARDLAGAIGAW